MKKVKVKYELLLFLYSYLRMIDLSLDRSRWTAWNELQSYFENRIRPSQVIKYLKTSFKLPEKDLANSVYFIEKKSIADRIRAFFLRSFLIRQNELIYCCKLLWCFQEMLESDIEKYNLEIEKLRVDIATYYVEVLGEIVRSKDLNVLMRVEHFWQSDMIEVVELSKFIPDDFPRSEVAR